MRIQSILNSSLIIFLVLTTLTFPFSDSGQENSSFRVNRERILGFDMRAVAVGPFHSTVAANSSAVVWSQPIITSLRVDQIRIHVEISQGSSPGYWKLRFKDLSGVERDSIDRDSARGKNPEAWSNDIPRSGGLVELSVDSASSSVQVTVDRYAYPVQPTYPQAIWGTDDRRSIKSVSETIQQWGKPVARLRIMMMQGRALCTGFLVSSNLLLTNQHCVKNQSEALSTTADFGYDDAGSIPDQYSTDPRSDHNLELVDSEGSGLDYALIRLAGNPGQKYGHATFDPPDPKYVLNDHNALVVIEHAGGLPKAVSIKDCEVSGAELAGIQKDHKTDFGHHCDTLGGASGSPIFDFQTGKIVGLHHMGFTASSTTLDNQGIYMAQILRDISAQSTAIYNEIMAPAH
jgi:V8-like Glu-specific endopeptidase